MIKGKVKDVVWVVEGLLTIWIAVAFLSGHPIAAVAPGIIFLANLMLIGAGSRADGLFLLYPYGAFLVLFGVGFYVLFYYWRLFYGKPPAVLWLGMHPGSAVIWIGFGLVGGIAITILSYTLLFERNVLSQKDWEAFIEDVKRFKTENTGEQEALE